MGRRNIYIPDELDRCYERYQGQINLSQICATALADLMRQKFGEAVFDTVLDDLIESMNIEWNREADAESLYRQFSAAPTTPKEIGRDTYLTLFPGTEIPSKVHPPFGFPFVPECAPGTLMRDASKWMGSIPPKDRNSAPRYLWMLKRDLAFAYREAAWEADDMNVQGHVHIKSLFAVALGGTYFLRRLVEKCGLEDDLELTLSFELNGMLNRGIVVNDIYGIVERPHHLSSENRIVATLRKKVGNFKVENGPLRIGLDLVGEIILPFRPELATDKALKERLRIAKKTEEQLHLQYRTLDFVRLGE